MNHQFTVKHKHSSSFSISASRFNFDQLLLFYTKEYLSYERKLASFKEPFAATFKNNFGSVEFLGEKVWKNFGFFDARKSDCLMEKINFPENTLIYLNQSHLTVKKNKEIFCCD